MRTLCRISSIVQELVETVMLPLFGTLDARNHGIV